MPLVVLCGIPGSGKSAACSAIQQYLVSRGKRVVCVVQQEEESRLGVGMDVDATLEKTVRSALKEKVLRLLDSNTTVMLDATNYIKGFRYELYCGSKSVKSTQCTVYTLCNIEWAKANTKLPPQVFDAFEEPNGSNRWDSPLVMWGEDREERREELLHQVYAALYERAPPPPNLSTQNAPLSDTKFLQRLDQVTKEVCERATNGLIPGLLGDPPPPPQLSRLRRQFLTYSKMNLSNKTPEEIAHLFTRYLVTTLKETHAQPSEEL